MPRLPFFRRQSRDVAIVRALPQTTEPPTVSSVSGFRSDSTSVDINPEQARQLADTTPWVRSAIDKIKGKVARAERGIFPIDSSRPSDPELQARLTYLLENPNPRGDSWRTFSERVVEDVLVLGKGGWEYVPNFKGWPLALYDYNARFMHVDPTWDGRDPKAPRYSWREYGRTELFLRNDEITMLLDNPATHRAEGWSKLAVLKRTLESDSAGDDYIRSLLEKYLPPGWLDLGPKATARQVKDVSTSLRTNVLGKGGILVTGNSEGGAFHNLHAGNSRDMELQAWSEYFGRKVAIVFGLSPMDLGITADLNKASAGVAQDVSGEDGAISILSLFEEMYNREVVAKFGTPEKINLALRFKDVTWAERERRAKMSALLSGTMPVYQLNELRDLNFLPPIEGGNAIWVATRMGPIAVLGEDAGPQLAAEDQESNAEDEDEGSQDGGNASQEQEDTAGNKAPKDSNADVAGSQGGKSASSGKGAQPPQDGASDESRAVVEGLLRAYLRMWSGSVDWRLELAAPVAEDARLFVLESLTKPEADTPRAYALAATRRAKLQARAPITLLALPAYALAEQLNDAVARAA